MEFLRQALGFSHIPPTPDIPTSYLLKLFIPYIIVEQNCVLRNHSYDFTERLLGDLGRAKQVSTFSLPQLWGLFIRLRQNIQAA